MHTPNALPSMAPLPVKEVLQQALCEPVPYRGLAQVALGVQDMTENMTVETETAIRTPCLEMMLSRLCASLSCTGVWLRWRWVRRT